jgi:hypothetical protein
MAVDIRVGATSPIGSRGEKTDGGAAPLEAKILAVRAPRRRAGGPPGNRVERREGKQGSKDPLGGKVLVLMIPDGSRLPEGIESGEYRIFLRFARR